LDSGDAPAAVSKVDIRRDGPEKGVAWAAEGRPWTTLPLIKEPLETLPKHRG